YMVRAAYWLQNGTLHHFNSGNRMQLYMAPNASILVLWTLAFLKSDIIANVSQWFAYSVLGVAVYRASFLFGASVKGAIFSALIFLSLKMVLLQSNSAQHDLVVTAFTFISFYFFHSGIKEKCWSRLTISSIACGLAIGTKGTIFYMAPALLVATIGIAFVLKARPALYLKWIVLTFLCFMVLGSYNYIQNQYTFGNPLAPKGSIGKQHGGNMVSKGMVNIGRYVNDGSELDGLPTFIGTPLIKAKASLFKKFFSGPPLNLEDDSFPGWPFKFKRNTFNIFQEDSAWFGFLGFFLYMPLSFWIIINALYRRRLDPRLFYIFIAGFYFVFLSVMQNYGPFKGRYFVLSIVFLAPLSYLVWELRRKWIRIILITSIVLIGAHLAVDVSLLNEGKPLLGEMSVIGKSYYQKRFTKLYRQGDKYHLPVIINELIPPGARIGYAVKGNLWSYAFFGRDFSKEIVVVNQRELKKEGARAIIKDYSLDFLIIEESEVIDTFIRMNAGSDDPLFPYNHNTRLRLVSARSWEDLVAEWSGRARGEGTLKLAELIDIFGTAYNFSRPLELLFDRASETGFDKEFTVWGSKMKIDMDFSLFSRLGRLDKGTLTQLLRVKKEVLIFDGRVTGKSRSVKVSLPGGDVREIKVELDGTFQFLLYPEPASEGFYSNAGRWREIKFSLPDGASKDEWLKLKGSPERYSLSKFLSKSLNYNRSQFMVIPPGMSSFVFFGKLGRVKDGVELFDEEGRSFGSFPAYPDGTFQIFFPPNALARDGGRSRLLWIKPSTARGKDGRVYSYADPVWPLSGKPYMKVSRDNRSLYILIPLEWKSAAVLGSASAAVPEGLTLYDGSGRFIEKVPTDGGGEVRHIIGATSEALVDGRWRLYRLSLPDGAGSEVHINQGVRVFRSDGPAVELSKEKRS
ncbi:MAG: glycosyltransferase family 39 protein, partial [Thermodesulfobacteriota bacterium]